MQYSTIKSRALWRWQYGLMTTLAIVLLIGSAASRAAAIHRVQPVEAAFTGTFAITGDIGQSVLFVIEETGSGNEQTELGHFSYTSTVTQNLARVPDGCGSNSSTGVAGTAVLSFSDGELRLKRSSGTSCFAFPAIHIEEQWVIASGTGRYLGATGDLLRIADGDVRYRTTRGTFSGVIRLDA